MACLMASVRLRRIGVSDKAWIDCTIASSGAIYNII